MAGKSDYLENKVLDHIFGATAYTAPATIYMALFTATPADSGGGTEVSGGAYARAAITNNTTNWPAASGGVKSNGTTVTFPTSTAAWGNVTHFGFYDASTAGNLLYFGALDNAQNVGINNVMSFTAGTLTLTED